MLKIKEITLSAVFVSIALIMFIIENQIPIPIPIVGLKLGFSNIITLVTLTLLNKKMSFVVLTLRILLAYIICGGGISIIYSLSGGLFCYLVMIMFYRKFTIPITSVLGAIAHNTAQLLVASFILKSFSIFVYMPVLLAFAIISGFITGYVALLCVSNVNIIKFFKEYRG